MLLSVACTHDGTGSLPHLILLLPQKWRPIVDVVLLVAHRVEEVFEHPTQVRVVRLLLEFEFTAVLHELDELFRDARLIGSFLARRSVRSRIFVSNAVV